MFTFSDLNEKNVFESIAEFYNGRAFLKPHEQESFALKVREFFKEKAFYDITVAIPENFKKRFTTMDLESVLDALHLPLSEIQRTVATVEKVTGLHFGELKKGYQIQELQIEDAVWGFICRNLIDSSSLSKTSQVLQVSDLSPSSYRVMDHLAGSISILNTRQGTVEKLLTFAKKWNIKSLESSLSKCTLDEISLEVKVPSRFFDEKNPIQSALRFTKRFAALDHSEQNELFTTISTFFRMKAYKGQVVEIPEELVKEFSFVAIPFLVDHIPIEMDRHCLIASIQYVTKRQFLSLGQEDLLHPVNIQYDDEKMPMSILWSWLKKEFYDSKINSPLELKVKNAKTATIFKEVQYPPIDLKESGSQEAIVELFYLTVNTPMAPFASFIEAWLQKEGQLHLIVSYAIKKLDQKEVFNALKSVKNLPILSPSTYLDDETYYHILKFNLEYYKNIPFKKVYETSFGICKPKIDVLVRYRRDVQDESLQKKIDDYLIDTHLMPFLEEKYYYRSFFQAAVPLYREQKSKPAELKKSLKELSLKSSSSEMALELLQEKKSRQFFVQLGFLDMHQSFLTALHLNKDYSEFVENLKKDLASKKPSPSGFGLVLDENFSEAIKRVIEEVELKYKKQTDKADFFLSTFFKNRNDCIQRLVFCPVLPSDLDGQFKQVQKHLDGVSISLQDARLLITLLEQKEVQEFLVANDVLGSIPFIRYLQFAIRQLEVGHALSMLKFNFEFMTERDCGTKLEKVKDLLNELKKDELNPQVDIFTYQKIIFELLDKYSLLEKVLINEIKFDQEIESKSSFTINLERVSIIRTGADTFFVRSKDCSHIRFIQLMNQLSGWDKRPITGGIGLDEAKIVYDRITNKDLIEFFAKDLDSIRELLTNRLKEFIQEEERKKEEKAKKNSSWFPSIFN